MGVIVPGGPGGLFYVFYDDAWHPGRATSTVQVEEDTHGTKRRVFTWTAQVGRREVHGKSVFPPFDVRFRPSLPGGEVTDEYLQVITSGCPLFVFHNGQWIMAEATGEPIKEGSRRRPDYKQPWKATFGNENGQVVHETTDTTQITPTTVRIIPVPFGNPVFWFIRLLPLFCSGSKYKTWQKKFKTAKWQKKFQKSVDVSLDTPPCRQYDIVDWRLVELPNEDGN
jgi:hypothetical protein